MITKDEIIKAIKGMPAISAIPSEDRYDAVNGLIKRTYAIKGMPVTPESEIEINAATEIVLEKVAIRWPWLKLGEIRLAFEGGACGDIGRDTRPNIANFIAWLTAYTQLDERREAINAVREANAAPKANALPPVDTDAQIAEHVMKQWKMFKAEGNVKILADGYAATLYDFLANRGKVNPTEHTISIARERARTRKRNGISEIGADNDGTMTEFAVKRELLTMYFQNLKQRNVDLKL